jgi:hypothetical protein
MQSRGARARSNKECASKSSVRRGLRQPRAQRTPQRKPARPSALQFVDRGAASAKRMSGRRSPRSGLPSQCRCRRPCRYWPQIRAPRLRPQMSPGQASAYSRRRQPISSEPGSRGARSCPRSRGCSFRWRLWSGHAAGGEGQRSKSTEVGRRARSPQRDRAYAQLMAAHVGERGATTSTIGTEDAIGPRDGRDACVGAFTPDVSALHHRDGVPLALIFAYQHGAGLEAPVRHFVALNEAVQ